MLNCSACGLKLRYRSIEGRKYLAQCERCGLEHSLTKKESYHPGDEVSMPLKDGVVNGKILEKIDPDYMQVNGGVWIPKAYKVQFPVNTPGTDRTGTKVLTEVLIYRAGNCDLT